MQVASPRRRGKSPDTAVVLAAAQPPALRLPAGVLESVRQDYLDALPIAATILYVGDDGEPRIDISNRPFRAIAECSPKCRSRAADCPLIRSVITVDALDRFITGDEETLQFDAHDGRGIGGRHFTIRMAKLKASPVADERVLLAIIDKTSQVETERNLRAEMLRDSLTGLPNRLAFNERVEEILDNPDFKAGSHAVLCVDMTRFSRVNECVGAIAGDELLITFARRLISALRAGDILARTGGDEFGILMRLRDGIDDALQIAERIKTVLVAPFRLSELEIRVDCAIGCAMVTDGVEIADEVLRNAQFAMKRAKRTGEIQIYEPQQAKAARHRFSIETELRRAIENHELTLAFQPLIDLPTGEVSGFEALARWDHEERGSISPIEFIPVAEESGLINALGRWALDAAAQTMSDWDKEVGRALPLTMSVNVSAIQIARDDLAGAVQSALRASGIAGGRLTLELTESAIVQDPERAMQVLDALKNLDARVAMDDFGTGYTSLASLQRLPIDVLKIDRSFVTGMLNDRDSTAIIRAVLSVANALGMATTAEGVETEELARALTDLGCTHGQGFFFARPLEARAALDYWLSRNA